MMPLEENENEVLNEQEEPEGTPYDEAEEEESEEENPINSKQNRWRSKYLWISVASVVAFILGNWGIYEKVGLTNESFQNLVNLILSALATMGIINNPTDKKNW